MTIFYEYLCALLQNWWWFLTSGPYIVESLVKQLWSGYEDWADRFVPAQKRRKISTWLAISGIFVAGFLVYSDERIKLHEAHKQIAMFQGENADKQQRHVQLMRKFSDFFSKCRELMFSNINPDQLPTWNQRQKQLSDEMSAWVEKNVGVEAKAKLLDTTVFTNGVFIRPFNAEQREKLVWLDKVCYNLRRVMQDVSMQSLSTNVILPS